MPRKQASPNQLNEISKRFFNRVSGEIIPPSSIAVRRNPSWRH